MEEEMKTTATEAEVPAQEAQPSQPTKAERKQQKKAEKAERAEKAEAEKAEADRAEEERAQARAKVATEDEWRSALETAVKQRDDYLEMARRTQADFQNFKRRNEQIGTERYDEGVRDALSAMLPVLDNLDRAIAAAEQAPDIGKLIEGVQMTRRQMLDSGAKLGLQEVPALGEKFDPELHNAVMRTEEGEPGTVLEVFQKGYRVKDKIIRYAMVKVAAE
ncbi:MAG: nucleotide exchange factor GrpE [Clostridia bacterium]